MPVCFVDDDPAKIGMRLHDLGNKNKRRNDFPKDIFGL
jgi:hypothetical protein